jgi:hypothetical protein
MSKATKRLTAMDENPAGDWRMADIEMVCRAFGVHVGSPRRGSHFTVSHPDHVAILTIPSRRPIKPVYIREFVSYILDVKGAMTDGPA